MPFTFEEKNDDFKKVANLFATFSRVLYKGECHIGEGAWHLGWTCRLACMNSARSVGWVVQGTGEKNIGLFFGGHPPTR